MEEGLALCAEAVSEPATKAKTTKIDRMIVMIWKIHGASSSALQVLLLGMICFAAIALEPETRSEVQSSQPQEP